MQQHNLQNKKLLVEATSNVVLKWFRRN